MKAVHNTIVGCSSNTVSSMRFLIGRYRKAAHPSGGDDFRHFVGRKLSLHGSLWDRARWLLA